MRWSMWLTRSTAMWRSGTEMVATAGGEVEGVGLSFLVLTSQGRIQSDYQFNPTINETNELVERYVAIWNEPNPDVRYNRIAGVWAANGAYLDEIAGRNGHSAIAAEAARVYNALAATDRIFTLANHAQAHHNVASLRWHMRARHCGAVKAEGSDLLILDKSGRVGFGYRCEERAG